MIDKMYRFLLAVNYKNTFPMGRKVTVGELAKALRIPRATANRWAIRACGLGLVETEKFTRGKQVCYSFKVSQEGEMFMNSTLEILELPF